MINLSFAKDQNFYLIGMGKSNQMALKSLQKAGAGVKVWDDKAEVLNDYGPELVCAPDRIDWAIIDGLVTAPGILPDHPILKQAKDHQIPVLCDIDLYMQANPKSKIIGVTGTNGKSTTTALIHHILNGEGQSQTGGNIGNAVLGLKSTAKYTVLELSSYQLSRTPHLKCDVAVLLNITPDHLAWHKTMDDYVAAKAHVFYQAGTRIISVDDDYSKSIADQYDDAIRLSVENEAPFQHSQFPKLKGVHNLQNALAAYYTCRALEIDHDTIIERMKSFEGLAHRQYLVRVINGIPYINDSKATNAEASKQALRAFRNIIWIAGGEPKDGGLEGIDNDLKHVKKAYTYGQAGEDFANYLQARGIDVETGRALPDVVVKAHEYAQEQRGEPSGAPTVLFSPAAASFDQYNNFEERGDHFCTLVNALDDE